MDKTLTHVLLLDTKERGIALDMFHLDLMRFPTSVGVDSLEKDRVLQLLEPNVSRKMKNEFFGTRTQGNGNANAHSGQRNANRNSEVDTNAAKAAVGHNQPSGVLDDEDEDGDGYSGLPGNSYPVDELWTGSGEHVVGKSLS